MIGDFVHVDPFFDHQLTGLERVGVTSRYDQGCEPTFHVLVHRVVGLD